MKRNLCLDTKRGRSVKEKKGEAEGKRKNQKKLGDKTERLYEKDVAHGQTLNLIIVVAKVLHELKTNEFFNKEQRLVVLFNLAIGYSGCFSAHFVHMLLVPLALSLELNMFCMQSCYKEEMC